MPEYLSPGVYIEEIQGPQPIQAVGTSTGAFVGIAQSGPVHSAQLITNYTQFANTFGGFLPGAFLAYAVQNFFNEGGTRCYVVRAFVNSGAPSTTVPRPDVATANLTTTGVSTDPVAVAVYANSPGTWGNALSVQVLADTFDSSNTPTAALNAGGTGYKVGDVLTLVQTGASGGTVTVASVSATGVILTASLTAPGTGYTTANGLAVTGGAGTGATFNYNANPNQEFQLQVFETAAGSTLPTLVETYTHVSMIESNANGIPNPNHIEQRINGISNYISVVHASTEPTTNAPPAPQTAALNNGTNGLSPGPSSVTAAMHAADLIGAVATALTPATGLHAFDTVDDIEIVAIPDLVLPGFSAPDGRNATLTAIAYCELRKDCFFVADPPSGMTPQKVLDYKQGQNSFSGNAFNSKYAALYYPWIRIADPLTGGLKLAPPSGAMVGRYSATDVARGVFKAPAGTVDGYINSALDIERITSQGEQDTLNPEGINVIRKFADAGIVIWGARTTSSDTEWTYVPVRRLVIMIEQSILLGTQGVVFEPNDPALWKRIIRDVSAFLRLQWMSGALFGDKAEQAYFVKCDSETNPPESIAVGRVVTVVGIAPVKPAEFVIFQIQLMSGGGSVSE